MTAQNTDLSNRIHTQFSSTISRENNHEIEILGQPLVKMAQSQSFARIAFSLLLGKPIRSAKTESLIDLILKLLIDHGPYQSGVVNTIIASRAGKDLVSSLTSGLLTIGPRFGGALNNAAKVWFEGVNKRSEPREIVENFARQQQYLPGIGHRHYRLEIPDQRVILLKKQAKTLVSHQYLDFALAIEKITTAKKANLILNIDGAVGAILLDFLAIEEKYNLNQLAQLIEIEFFNSLFVLSRSFGLVGHYLDQKRLNEPLFRLEPDQVFTDSVDS